MINTAIDNVLFKRGLMAKDKKQSKRRNSSISTKNICPGPVQNT